MDAVARVQRAASYIQRTRCRSRHWQRGQGSTLNPAERTSGALLLLGLVAAYTSPAGFGETFVATKKPKNPSSGADGAAASWKDSRPIIAIIAGAAGIAATSTAFLTFFIPAHEADRTARIKQLETERSESDKKLAATEAELASARASLTKAESEAKAIRADLTGARLASLFSLGDPYPNGLRAIHVGADMGEVQRAFPKAVIDKKVDGVLVLRGQHAVFTKVSYFFDPEGQDRRITHIVFEIESEKDYDDKFLLGKLRDALGDPAPGSKPAQCAWLKPKRPWVFKLETHSFMVTLEEVKPKAWKPGPRSSDACT